MAVAVFNRDAIPSQLKAQRIWVLWKREHRDGKPTKVLYQTNGRRAKSNTPDTWASFDEVCSVFDCSFDYAGIGIVINPPLFGIDLDACINSDGSLTQWAAEALEKCPTYCEVSPSGEGLKLLGIGDLPMPLVHTDNKMRCGRVDKDVSAAEGATKKPELAIWRQKFFAITGQVYQGYADVKECPNVADLFNLHFTPTKKSSAQVTVVSDEYTERSRAFMSAIAKIPISTPENDGSHRLVLYARQAKRFMSNEDDALRVVKAAATLHPFPVDWSDDQILRRISQVDIKEFGEGFMVDTTESWKYLKSVGGVPINGSAEMPVAPVSPEAQAPTKPEPKPDPFEWEVCDFNELRSGDKPERGEEIIQGLLRDGEVGFIGSVSKSGKSWLVGYLIWCIVTGCNWLGLNVKKGKVLLIDNELKKREIDWRHWQICRALHHFPEDGELKVVSRRGKSCDINLVADRILQMDLTGVVLIVIDAIYKAIPDGKSENDNEAMGKLMNTLQNIAERKNIAVMCVHHATKGDQSHKSTLDILAGAGSFGRSLDAMIAVRDHEQEGLNVIEFRSRTNPDPEPISAKFAFPLWESVTVQPEVKKPKSANETNQAKRDKEAKEKVAANLSTTKWRSVRQLRRYTGMGEPRVEKGLAMLAGQIVHKRVKRQGKITDVYQSSGS